MSILLFVIAVLEAGAGLYVIGGSKSAVHEVLGMLAIGFAFLTFGMAGLVKEAERIRAKLTEHTERMDRKIR